MLKKANISWTAKQLTKMVNGNKITFENVVQRTYVWDVQRKSLLIHSMLTGYPIPSFYATKKDGVYDMLDGKQRMNAIVGFINGDYALTDIPDVETETEVLDINGKLFDDLSEELQDEIKDYTLTIYYFEDISEDEVSEMFFRLNNGKALSAIELTRVKAKSISTIIDIGKHELFNSALTEKALAKYTNEDIVMKTYAVLYVDEPSLETKDMRKLMLETEITDEQKEYIKKIYDKIMEIHSHIEDKKVARKILVRTHLISIIPFIAKAIEEGRSDEDMVFWLTGFFKGKGRAASVSDIYNGTTRSGSNKKESVRARNLVLQNSYNEYFKIGEENDDTGMGETTTERKEEVQATGFRMEGLVSQ